MSIGVRGGEKLDVEEDDELDANILYYTILSILYVIFLI